MAKNFDMMEDSNRSGNPSIHDVSMPGRRVVIQGGLAALLSGVPAPWLASCTSIGSSGPLLGFKGIAAGAGDTLVVPEGYVAEAIVAWGEPVGIAGAMPAWASDASNTAAEQALQMGMHHDGIHLYPLEGNSTRGLLAMNHQYVDDGLLHPDGLMT